jgi:hypothetical protein
MGITLLATEVAKAWSSGRYRACLPNDFRMFGGVLRELGGEIDARQILDLVARCEFVVRALTDSTPLRTFENGEQNICFRVRKYIPVIVQFYFRLRSLEAVPEVDEWIS